MSCGAAIAVLSLAAPAFSHAGVDTVTRRVTELLDPKALPPTETIRSHLYLAQGCKQAKGCPGMVTLHLSGR